MVTENKNDKVYQAGDLVFGFEICVSIEKLTSYKSFYAKRVVQRKLQLVDLLNSLDRNHVSRILNKYISENAGDK